MSDDNNLIPISEDHSKDTTISGGISFATQKFAFGQRIGLKIDSSKTTAIEAAIDALTKVEGDISVILDTLFGAEAPSNPNFGFDPNSKWLAGVAITYGVLTFDVLLVDGDFYGLIIKVGKPPKKKNGDKNGNGKKNGEKDSGVDATALATADGDGNGNGNGNGDDKPNPFTGLKLEIIYRKINDHLGEFSADLTLPGKFRKIKLEAATITLPSVGLAIWTNGDFSVSIGWPLGDRSFNIAFPPDPIPWAGGGGLYFAKLRSEDNPGKLGTNFNPIIQFGIGLRIGAATEGDYGILSYGASLYLFGTFQGFLAWADGSSFSDGINYYWFCASVGITGHLEGEVDFVVIKVTVSLDITASVTLALETGHACYAQAEFTATVEAKIKILFITIHFSFTIDLKVSITIGSGPPALITGPTPPPPPPPKALMETAAPALTGEVAAISEMAFMTLPPPAPVAAKLSFLLQPTIRFDVPTQKWVSAGIASLIIDRGASGGGTGVGTDSFSLMVQSLATYILGTYGGYTDPTANLTPTNLQTLQSSLGGDPSQCGGTAQDPGPTQFTLQAIYNWLASYNVSFTVTGTNSSSSGSPDGAIFPMIPGLVLTYNGAGTTFSDQAAPAGYLTVLENYFAQLSMIGDGSINPEAMRALAETVPVGTPSWMPGVIFADYFNILAKQICQDLCNLVQPPPPQPVQSYTLAQGLAKLDIGNMAGIVTRFLQHGLRLPDPNSPFSPTMDTYPLYFLTGQQFDIASANNAPVSTAVLSGSGTVKVTFNGDGSSHLPFVLDQAPAPPAALLAPTPLDPINYVQSSYMLQQGVPWAQQATKWSFFAFPDTLQSQLRQYQNLLLALSATDGNTPPVPASGAGSLMIRFSLTQVPNPNGPGFLPTVFQVNGTDESTRDLMEILFASSDMGSVEVDMMLPVGNPNQGGGYSTSANDAKTVIFKTNLSTYNQPNGGMMMSFMMKDTPAAEGSDLPPLGTTSAPISDASNFLLLLWECSIVHSGGFYLYVPDLTFASGVQQVDVAVMVKDTSAPAETVSLSSYQNTIMVATAGLSANDRVSGRVSQTNYNAVTEPKPNYPAGTIAFGATWTGAPVDPSGDTAAYATFLYQMLEFQIPPGTGITTGSGWSMPLGPNTPKEASADTWIYQRAVPVYRFVDGADQNYPNRYGAIGLQTNLNLQLVDIFGNSWALKALPSMAVYNDPLITVDEWPGAYILYTFSAAAAGTAQLQLTVTFKSEQIDTSLKKTTLDYYRLISDQLTDPRVSLSITTAVAAGPVTLQTTGGTGTLAALAAFIGAIVAYLDGSSATPPADIQLSGTVPINYITQIEEDLFPLWVSLTTTRSAPAGSESINYPDGFLSVVSPLPPLLSTVDNPDPDATDPTALRDWSINFELGFNNFDSSKGMLKVLVGTPPEKVKATKSMLGSTAAGAVTSAPGDLWAMKWSAADGVTVVFGNSAGGQVPPNQQPVYFAPVPLSTELVSTTVQINNYDGQGKPTGAAAQIFSGVDMDGLGRSFLQAFDTLLTPDLANAMAQLDPVQYALLMTYKEELAFAVSSSITWVLQAQMPGNSTPGLGDLKSAQDRFRQSMLSSLGNDYTTSVIVQVPAAVTVKNQFESDDDSSRPPDFFGNPTPVAVAGSLSQYTISTTALPVTDGPGYLNFLVGAIDPTINADLNLTFNYDINFLDHQFETSEEQYGYTPSSWLRFVVPDQDPTNTTPTVLDVPMGTLDIPIPLRAYPSPPRLVSQTATSTYPNATNPPPTTIAQAILFDYNLTVGRPQVAQDDLHMTLEFNGANIAPSSQTASGGALFSALANFQAFQGQYLNTATQAILATQSGGDKTVAEQWLKDIAGSVQAVADAWQATYPPQMMADFAGDPPVPAPFTWEFVLQVPHEGTPNVMTLTWVPNASYTGSPVWPTIDGATGTSTGNNVMTYTLPATPGDPNFAQPTLTWPGLSVITNQSISTAAWIERNEELANGQATNPAFVYITSTVSFPSPVIPLLQVPGKITVPTQNSGTMVDAVSYAITQVMQPTTPISNIGIGIEANYSFVLVAGGPGQLTTTLPVFLVKTAISTESTPTPPAESPQELITALQGALSSWHSDFQPSPTNASLLFDITIFAANSQQPLARLLDIEAGVIGGDSWWNPPT